MSWSYCADELGKPCSSSVAADRFPPSRYGPFLGIDRGDDLVQIQVFWAPGKTVDAKLAMYRKIVEPLGTNPGVRPEDVLISVVETAAENWSFGNGETQFYKPREVQGARA